MSSEWADSRRPGAIEILSRAGLTLQRMAWDGAPLRVGRAYDNDLIVGDPYVCPHHLELGCDAQGPFVRDTGSVNGTYAGHGKDRIERARLEDGLVLHFGHSQLRFHAAGSPVTPTLRDTARHGLLGRLGSPWVLGGSIAFAALALVLYEFLVTAGQPGWLQIAGEMLYPLIGVLIWSGFWSLLNRVMSHRANFGVHLSIGMLGIASLFAASQLSSVVAFALGWGGAAWLFGDLVRALVAAVVIYAHLRYALHGRPSRLGVAAALAAILAFGTPATGDLIERSEFSSLPYLEPLLWPPAFRLAGAESAETFFREAEVLRQRVDREAKP